MSGIIGSHNQFILSTADGGGLRPAQAEGEAPSSQLTYGGTPDSELLEKQRQEDALRNQEQTESNLGGLALKDPVDLKDTIFRQRTEFID